MNYKNDFFVFRKKNFILAVIVIIIFSVSVSFAVIQFIPSKNTVKFNGDNVDENKIAKFQNILNQIDKNFYVEYDINDLIEGAINGTVTALNDKYTVYYKPGSMDSYKQHITGNFNGIGITTLLNDKGLLITEVSENSPAYKIGLAIGDTITHINEISVLEMTNEEIIENTSNVSVSFSVTILHSDDSVSDSTIIPEIINKNSVNYKEYDNKIFYLQITQFDDNTGTEFEDAVKKITEIGCNGLIIDLRNNGGGYAREAAKVADVILPKGDIAYEKNRKGVTTYTFTSNDGEISCPIVMLINEYTASASELLAGAFKDFNKGVIIGTTSYGKALGQTSFSFENDNSGFVMTIAKYYTPSGISIQGVGIVPDIVLLAKDEYKGVAPSDIPFEEDLQLIKAFEELGESVN